MSAEPNISPQDYELLSAYIDGELSDIEHATIEQRLSNEPQLAQELDAMRNTVTLINQLPSMTAPRDFTITEAMVRPSNVIPLRTRPRPYTPYLSLVASVALMIFGVMFMLSDIAPTQDDLTTASDTIQQSEPVTGSLGEVAVLATNTAQDDNSEADRARIEPATTTDSIQEETTEEEAPVADLANIQAPANNAVASDTTFEAESDGSGIASDEDAGDPQDESLDKVGEDDGIFATELQVMDAEMEESVDGTAGEGFFEATAEDLAVPPEPQAMAGASFAEPATALAPDLADNADDAMADAENVESQIVAGSNAPAETITDIADSDNNDTVAQERRDVPTPTLQPPPPSEPVREAVTEPKSNNLPIGIGLLAIGVLLLTASVVMIRRYRS